jgi:chorismate mutase/prephenate dehydratase
VAIIWREIMSACRALEAPQRVAYLGPAGTFSEQAAIQFFGGSMARVLCVSIRRGVPRHGRRQRRVWRGADRKFIRRVISRSLDLLLNSPPAHHWRNQFSGAAQPAAPGFPALDDIEVVYAHPQALAQCQDWLTTHLPQGRAPRRIQQCRRGTPGRNQPGLGRPLPANAPASEFGLHVASHAIQDDAFNRTRFAIICLPQTLAAPQATGNDCTSLIVSVTNRPGAVHDLLVPLKKHGVSMTRFESRPARSGQWEYYFYIDLAGHPSQPNVSAALDELRSLCAFYKVLGTYPVAE